MIKQITLAHFKDIFSIYTLWKHQQTYGFLMFLGRLRKGKFAWNELSESFPSYMNNLSSKKKVSQEKY